MRTKYCSKKVHVRDADVDYWTILKLYIIYVILVLCGHRLVYYNEPQLNKLLFYFM
jgi:hypothetical protein